MFKFSKPGLKTNSAFGGKVALCPSVPEFCFLTKSGTKTQGRLAEDHRSACKCLSSRLIKPPTDSLTSLSVSCSEAAQPVWTILTCLEKNIFSGQGKQTEWRHCGLNTPPNLQACACSVSEAPLLPGDSAWLIYLAGMTMKQHYESYLSIISPFLRHERARRCITHYN